MSHLSFFSFVAVTIATMTACGSSGDSDHGPSSPAPGSSSSSSSPTQPAPSGTVTPADSTCGATTHALCEHACSCGTKGTCVIAYGSGSQVTEEHKTLADCENFYALFVCGQAQYAKDYDAPCGSALAGATCITTPSSGGAVAIPDACHLSK